MIGIALLWFFGSVTVATVANNRGRSVFGWLVLSLAFSPLLSGLALFALPKVGTAALPVDEMGNPISPDSHVRCPDCRELVRRDARKCKHCGTALIPQ